MVNCPRADKGKLAAAAPLPSVVTVCVVVVAPPGLPAAPVSVKTTGSPASAPEGAVVRDNVALTASESPTDAVAATVNPEKAVDALLMVIAPLAEDAVYAGRPAKLAV